MCLIFYLTVLVRSSTVLLKTSNWLEQMKFQLKIDWDSRHFYWGFKTSMPIYHLFYFTIDSEEMSKGIVSM